MTERHNGVDGLRLQISKACVSTISLMQIDTPATQGHHRVVSQDLADVVPFNQQPLEVGGRFGEVESAGSVL